MDFYTALSRYYDVIFPPDRQALSFLSRGLEPASKILDLACGTGSYSLLLAEEGHRVWGIDSDREMVRRARGKARRRRVRFVRGDMTAIENLVPGRFDLVFCLGNSLVHLASAEAIYQLFCSAAILLKRGGLFATQIINYDGIVPPVDLPTIVRAEEGLEFHRKYTGVRGGTEVSFETRLVLRNEELVLSHAVPLLALKSDTLLEMLNAAGFVDLELYGDFQEDPHSSDSFLSVCRARRPKARRAQRQPETGPT
jgi:SAM-dependent methyltransferase